MGNLLDGLQESKALAFQKSQGMFPQTLCSSPVVLHTDMFYQPRGNGYFLSTGSSTLQVAHLLFKALTSFQDSLYNSRETLYPCFCFSFFSSLAAHVEAT